jgi:hypothetical protein
VVRGSDLSSIGDQDQLLTSMTLRDIARPKTARNSGGAGGVLLFFARWIASKTRIFVEDDASADYSRQNKKQRNSHGPVTRRPHNPAIQGCRPRCTQNVGRSVCVGSGTRLLNAPNRQRHTEFRCDLNLESAKLPFINMLHPKWRDLIGF